MADDPAPRSQPDADTNQRLLALRTDLARLGDHVTGLRLQLLRIYAGLTALTLAAGLLLPAWAERPDRDEPEVAYRVLTVAGQIAMSAAEDAGEDDLTTNDVTLAWAMGIGFGGLALAAVLLIGILLVSVIGRSGRERTAWVRRTAGILTIIGGIVAAVFSLLGVSAENASGGWGPVVLIAGAVAAVALLDHAGWHDLWIIDRR